MGLKTAIAGLFGRSAAPAAIKQPRTRPVARRGFAAGEVDRLTESFLGSHLSINEELRRSLPRMQQRSRDLGENNDYARKFLRMVDANVIGPNGIKLQCQFTKPDGSADLADQSFVEREWQRWGQREHCSVDGKLSWREIESLAIRTISRDGEVLIQKIRSKRSPYILQLRVLECDHLDVSHNERLPGGRRIIMGVEVDANDKPLAYWLSDKHPGDYGVTHRKRRRVLADDILHLYLTDRPGQMRGVPWMHSAIRRLNMLGGYEEAELVAARIGASKMGFYTTPDGQGAPVDSLGPDSTDDDEYDLVQEAEPGLFEQLPEGYGFTAFDPQHPTAAFADFAKAVLRGAASGLNVSYPTFGNDLEGVNFSSIRSGVLEERDQWRMLQSWLSDVLHRRVYNEWITLEIIAGRSPVSRLPATKLESKFLNVQWQPRGWDWVDPWRDVKSKAEEYHLGTTTLSEIAASKGRSLDDIFRQRRAELDLAEQYGLTVGQATGALLNDSEATANDSTAQT